MTGGYVFIYCRISADLQGRAEGVREQEKWGRAYAAETWPGVPIKVFADNDLSAAKDDVFRPEFERMREGIRRGECAHLWAVEQTRLTRIETVWFQLATELDRSGVSEVHTRRGGVIDVGGVVAGIMAVLSAHEVKQLRQRLNDKKAALAAQGRPTGALGFGYRQVIYTPDEEQRLREWQERRHRARTSGQDMRRWKEDNPRPAGGKPIFDDQGRKSAVIVEHEAEIIRECAKRLLNGWGVKALATWLNEQDVKGKHGGRIQASSVSDFLTAPSVAGLATYRGEIVGKGTWQPILDEATWRSVCAVIGSRHKSRHRSRRAYLLTGYRMHCECGKPMQARGSNAGSKYRYYACEPSVTDGCGRTSIDAVTAENHVAVQLFDHLESLNAADMLPEDPSGERRAKIVQEMDGIDARRAELAELWPKKITTEQFNIMNDALRDEYADLERELAELPIPSAQTDPADLREAWPEMPLDEKRKFVDDWAESITVRHSPRGRGIAVNQKDVARHAGVSQSSVSRVVLGAANNAELEQRVRAAMKELGYIPGAGKHRRPTTNTDLIDIDWRR